METSWFVAIPLVGILFGGALGVIVVFVRFLQPPKRPSQARLEGELTGLIDQLAAEFPEEVRAWGGPGVLREPAIVEAIVERLNRERSAPETPQRPVPHSEEGEQLRQSALMTQVRRLADAHAKLTSIEEARKALRILLPLVELTVGTLIALLVGRFTENADTAFTVNLPILGSRLFDPIAAFKGVIAGFLCFGLLWTWFQGLPRAHEHSLARQVSAWAQELADEFPDEVRSWGGPVVLRDANAVMSIARRLAGGTGATTGEVGLRQVRRNSLVQRLADVQERLTRLERWPLWPRAVWGLVAGALIGWLVGEAAYGIVHSPRTFPNAFRSGETVDYNVIGLGIACGLLVWGVSFGVTAVQRSRRFGMAQGQLAVCIRELDTEFPDDVRSWGGEQVLRDPDAVRELLQLIRNQPLVSLR
jgi:hypothetical protein